MSDLATPQKLRKLQKKLYVKAKQEPEFRFYSLYDKVCWRETLWHAWRLSRRNDGAPGIDGVTFRQIEEEGVGKWLEALQQSLRDEEYEPSPVRRVEIPKHGGGKRPLGIPTVKDRVVQTAVKLIIEPIFEADLKDEAHGYRPDCGVEDAIEKVHNHLIEGRREVLDADLSSYFDTIPHDQLMQSVRKRVSDGTILELIKKWLRAAMIDEDDDGNRRIMKSDGEGTPQGGVISSLLANIYFNRFLKYWDQEGLDKQLDAKIVNYADDFVILTRQKARQALQKTRRVIEAMGLKLNEHKTKIRNVDQQNLEFLGYAFGWKHSLKGGEYLGAWPSKSTLTRCRRKLRKWFKQVIATPWKWIQHRLNAKLRGWANAYKYGSTREADWKIDDYVRQRVRALLSRRQGSSGRATQQWPDDRITRQLGVETLDRLRS